MNNGKTYIESRVVNGVMWGVVLQTAGEPDLESDIMIERIAPGGGATLLEPVAVSEIDDLISLLRKTKKTVTKDR